MKNMEKPCSQVIGSHFVHIDIKLKIETRKLRTEKKGRTIKESEPS